MKKIEIDNPRKVAAAQTNKQVFPYTVERAFQSKITPAIVNIIPIKGIIAKTL
jgi:hypothetical protein